MNFEIQYHPDVIEVDIPRLDGSTKKRVKKSIENKLVSHPEIFGKPLRRSLKGFLKLRVGDYRVIFKIQNKIVKILVIGHRSEVYRRNFGRLED